MTSFLGSITKSVKHYGIKMIMMLRTGNLACIFLRIPEIGDVLRDSEVILKGDYLLSDI